MDTDSLVVKATELINGGHCQYMTIDWQNNYLVYLRSCMSPEFSEVDGYLSEKHQRMFVPMRAPSGAVVRLELISGNDWLEKLKHTKGLKLIFGWHWRQKEDGWTILAEFHQDITHRLAFDDSSVDAIFIEHVLEHVTYDEAVFFLKEAHRILVRGGTLRIVTPDITKVMEFGREQSKHDKEYSLFAMKRHLPEKYPDIFLLNHVMRPPNNDHKFVWSAEMLLHELTLAGFDARKSEIGLGQESKFRGVKSADEIPYYDCESCHVEGVKRCLYS